MSLIFMDGVYWPISDIGYKYYSWDDVAITSETRRIGPSSIRIYWGFTVSAYLRLNISKDITTFIYGSAYYINKAADTGSPIVEFGQDGGQILSIQYGPSSSFQVVTGGVTYAAAPNTLTVGSWQYIEVKFTIGTTTGSFEFKCKEVSLISQSSIQVGSDGQFVDFVYWDHPTTYQCKNCFQDIYILDDTGTSNNDFLGDVKVDAIRPNNAGTYTDFTSLGGTNYSNVDESDSDGDTTYNESAVVGDKDTYKLESIPATGQQIFGIQQCSIIRKTDASSRYGKQIIKSGTTENLSSEIQFNDSYTGYQRCLDTDPDTSTAWTESGVNALESGLEITQ